MFHRHGCGPHRRFVLTRPARRWIQVDAANRVNEGTLRAAAGATPYVSNTWSSTGTVKAVQGGTVIARVDSANSNVGTLTGGTWRSAANSTLRLLVPSSITT